MDGKRAFLASPARDNRAPPCPRFEANRLRNASKIRPCRARPNVPRLAQWHALARVRFGRRVPCQMLAACHAWRPCACHACARCARVPRGDRAPVLAGSLRDVEHHPAATRASTPRPCACHACARARASTTRARPPTGCEDGRHASHWPRGASTTREHPRAAWRPSSHPVRASTTHAGTRRTRAYVRPCDAQRSRARPCWHAQRAHAVRDRVRPYAQRAPDPVRDRAPVRDPTRPRSRSRESVRP